MSRILMIAMLTIVWPMPAFAAGQHPADDQSGNDTSYLANLPPDPGLAGEATLAGIDSDNDGVRDDVQRWIALTYPHSQKTRAALTQDTKAMQQILLDAAYPIKSYKDALQDNRAMQCLSYIRPNDFYHVLAEHKAILLNTHLRSRAWLQADHNLSGKFFGLLPDPKQGCDFNPDANSTMATQTVTVNGPSLLATLPPDPGPAGMTTLAGIDADNDGVRDDVQRWIAINYPNSQKTRAALIRMSKTMQQFLINAADPARSYKTSIQMGKDTNCLAYILSVDFYQVSSELKAVILNTDLRTRAWLQADHHLSGKIFPSLPYSQWKQACNFNPDAMPN